MIGGLELTYPVEENGPNGEHRVRIGAGKT